MTLKYPYSDFILPGLRLDGDWDCLIAYFTFAASRDSNPRNLENPWYGFWGTIIASLTDNTCLVGQGHLTNIPQYRIWYKPTNELSSVADAGDAGDSSFASTIAESHTKWVDPDFSIIHFTYNTTVKVPIGKLPWPPPALDYIGVPLIVENKRGGKRKAWGVVFPKMYLRKSQYQLQHQAAHVFAMYPAQESVYLFGTAGHWWTFCCATRGAVFHSWTKAKDTSGENRITRSKAKGQTSAVLEDGAGSAGLDEVKGASGAVSKVDDDLVRRLVMENQDNEEDDEGSEGEGYDDEKIPYPPRILAEMGTKARTLKEIEPSLNHWSKAFEFGTRASNQRLWYLSDRLSKLSSDPKLQGVGQSCKW